MKLKALCKQIDESNFSAEFTASTPAVDRDKEIILPTAWNFKNFLKNPVLVNAHDYGDINNILGKVDVWVDSEGLHGKATYFVGQGNKSADWAWSLVRNGLASFSVGFIEKESKPGDGEIRKVYTKVELLEISQVVVPANPEAVISSNEYKDYEVAVKTFEELKSREVIDMEIKGVIPFKDTGKAPEDEDWDAGAEVREAEVEDLKIMCAWFDSENPDVKSSYKLPHHKAKGGHAAVWRGVAAAMAALLGARGGVNIPSDDKEGVYNHLSKHYKQFDKEPPEFYKEYESEEEILKACEIEEKTGRVLSESNRTKIKETLVLLKKVQEALTELLDISEPNTSSLGFEVNEAKAKLEKLLKIL